MYPPNDNPRPILSERYVIEVLMRLLEKEEIICGDLGDIIKAPRSREKIIKLMSDQNLIFVRSIIKPRKTYFITLTQHGKDVAVASKRAQSIADGGFIDEDDAINCSTPEVEGRKMRG